MSARCNRLASGFTLVELMVVLVVLAVTASLVSWSVSAARGHGLESAAEQLAAILEQARWQAISTGRRIAWELPQSSSAAGSTMPQARWYEQTQDGIWHLRVTPAAAALAGVSLTIAQPRFAGDTPARVVLGPEPAGAAVCILLMQEGSTVAVASDGIAPFAVRRDARC